MNYQTAVVQLPLVKEAKNEKITAPEDVCRVCSDMKDLAQESFQVLCLNVKNILIDRHLVTVGLVDASLVHPREVLRPAITDGASGVVLVHNHTCGDPTPSAQDVQITKQLVEAGKTVDIKVVDHVIIGRCVAGATADSADTKSRRFLSMREEGMCDFS